MRKILAGLLIIVLSQGILGFEQVVKGENLIFYFDVVYFTPDYTVDCSFLQNTCFSDANEGEDYHDHHFGGTPFTKALQLFSYEPGFKAGTNSKPLNTPYFEFIRGIKGYIEGPLENWIVIRLNDINDNSKFRNVIAYDVNEPNIIYNIPKDGNLLTINFPPLVEQEAGELATWRISLPPKVAGDCASEDGVWVLDGKVDYWDISVTAYDWLNESFWGENYNDGDINWDRKVDFYDFAIQASNWMKEAP